MSDRERRFATAHEPLMLQIKLEQIMQFSHERMTQFPKSEKYRLCSEIKECISDALHDTIRMQKKYYKKNTLQDIDVEIEYLRVLVRAAYSYRYISSGTLGVWMQHVDEAGSILGGLIKYFSSKVASTK